MSHKKEPIRLNPKLWLRICELLVLFALILIPSFMRLAEATIGSSDLWYAYCNQWQTPSSPEQISSTFSLQYGDIKWMNVALVVSVHEYEQYFTTGAVVHFRVNLYIDSFAKDGLYAVPVENVALHIEKDDTGWGLEKQRITMIASEAMPGFSQGNKLHQSIYINSEPQDRVAWGIVEALGFAIGLFPPAEPIAIMWGLINAASSFLPQSGPWLDYQDAGPQDWEAKSWWYGNVGMENIVRQYCFNSFEWKQWPSSDPATYYGIKVWAGMNLRLYDNPFGVSYIETPPVYLRIYSSRPNTPSTPAGPSSGYRWRTYSYTTSTFDPNGNNLRYQFDWGDGTSTWTGYYSSGSTASCSHSWGSIGAYHIRVRAQDTTGLYSDWSYDKKMNIINQPGNPCPTLFVWDGSEYTKIGVLDIHDRSDVTFMQGIEPILLPEHHLYKLSLRELDQYTSHIDCVKLYAVDNNVGTHECHLVQAIHSELGQVKGLLLRDDSKRVDLNPQQNIDLKFTVPNVDNIGYFIFEINGYNRKPP